MTAPRSRTLSAALALLLTGLLAVSSAPTPARGAPGLRVQTTQHGDFILIGNTLGQECAAGTPAPVVGTVSACGVNTADSAPDVYWRSDSPSGGQAEANTGVAVAQARSTAVLTLPAGAQVTHAYLYWSAFLASGSDTSVTLDRPGAGGFSTTVTALDSSSFSSRYRSVADVTALVQSHGEGAYRLSDVDMIDWINLTNANVFGAWWMVVLYQRDADPLRTLTVNDGLDAVSNATPADATLSGFLIPSAGIDAKLGVVALEGDNTTTGDSLSFNGTTLSDAQSPAANFFNGTRSYLGSAVSVAGDLPQLTGSAGSMSGIDMDVVDVSPLLAAGQTSASVSATTSGDVYFLATFVTSIATFQPEFGTSAQAVTDLNGGALVPGDTLEYTVTVANTGNDTATLTALTNPLPAGITFVPGSLTVDGAARTDAAGDDTAEYVSASRTIAARLGSGAGAAQGGSLAVGASATVRFRATLDAACGGALSIASQSTIATTGQLSGAPYSFLSDGDPNVVGSQPTTLAVDLRCLTVATSGSGTGQVSSAPAGISCGASCTVSLPSGSSITLTATPGAGSQFAGWSGAASGAANPLTLTLGASQVLTATFTLTTYTITPTAGLNGSISPAAPQTVAFGGSRAFTITPDSGYQVADVKVDGVSVGAVGAYTFTGVAADHTIAATFAPIPAGPPHRIYLPLVLNG